MAAAIVAPAVLLAVALSDVARAAEEYEPAEAGQLLTCSPATYDPSSGGNISYGPDDAFEEDFEIRLTGDLSVRYDRNAPGDDVLIRRLGAAGSCAEARSRYGAAVIEAGGENAIGIIGEHFRTGDIDARVQGGTIAATGQTRVTGIEAVLHAGSGGVAVTAEGTAIKAGGDTATGILAAHLAAGAGAVDVRGGRIEAAGAQADGIFVQAFGGGIEIAAEDVAIEIEGTEYSNGIVALDRTGSGDVSIATRNVDIKVRGGERLGGIFFRQSAGNPEAATQRAGVSRVEMRGGSIRTAGTASGAIQIHHEHGGNISIDVRDAAIETTGDRALGIEARHPGNGAGGVHVRVEGGTLSVKGPGGHGISVDSFDEETGAVRAAVTGSDGYHRQHVSVNGRVRGGEIFGSGPGSNHSGHAVGLRVGAQL